MAAQYYGWQCKTCQGENPILRKRCRKCGRARTSDSTTGTFLQHEDRRRKTKRK